MKLVRIFFEKRDRARYISHLDITRCLSRALARTDLPVWYTQGFNPRIYMTFALPLSLGYESGCESFDIKLTDDNFPVEEIPVRLNPVLPEGIRALRAGEPVCKAEAITRADYAIRIPDEHPDRLAEQFRAFLDQPQIMVVKKTKKAEREMDLKPLMELLSIDGRDGWMEVRLRLAAGIHLNISPALVLEAFSAYCGRTMDYVRVERLAILTESGEDFA
ncbi:TIGR03936 family radical SAM-associated protein [Angelakisella massiliensis]|uniref:TIGR03936 family radical SAM-associated protein n=1 Tax=Angelakisella massiliensis TaxID=1871018 RepID=UPI0023A880DD|nr:TIGR03936 family radical SAM-associated protein [Angelakisella massiliensis]